MITNRGNGAGKCLKCNQFYESGSIPECGACVNCSFEHFRGALLEAAFELERKELWGKDYGWDKKAKQVANLLRVSAGEKL